MVIIVFTAFVNSFPVFTSAILKRCCNSFGELFAIKLNFVQYNKSRSL